MLSVRELSIKNFLKHIIIPSSIGFLLGVLFSIAPCKYQQKTLRKYSFYFENTLITNKNILNLGKGYIKTNSNGEYSFSGNNGKSKLWDITCANCDLKEVQNLYFINNFNDTFTKTVIVDYSKRNNDHPIPIIFK